MQGTGVEMYSAQPGLVSSPLYSKGDHRKGTMLAVEFFQSFYGQAPVRGCRSLLRAATDPELVGECHLHDSAQSLDWHHWPRFHTKGSLPNLAVYTKCQKGSKS